MRNILLAIVVAALLTSIAAAEPSSILKPDKLKPDRPTAADSVLPMKGAGAGNSCAAFGAGFVRLASSDTCVKVGGAVSIQGGGSR